MHNDRLDLLTEYPFARLNALLEGVAPGRADPILLTIGEPRHRAPTHLMTALEPENPGWAKYPPTAGLAELRAVIAQWATDRYDLPSGFINPDQHVIPVSGSREALFMAASISVSRRKAKKRPVVLIPNPYYQVYKGAALMSGAEPIYVPAGPQTGFLPEYTALSEDILDRTALAYVCSPANPQGSVAGDDYWARMLELARKHDFMLAADECYSEIYDPAMPAPAGVLKSASKTGTLSHILSFNSLSKRSNVPGLRLGFMIADDPIIRRIIRLRSHGGAAPPLPVQEAGIALLRDEDHVHQSRALYGQKFAAADGILGHLPGYHRPAGGFCLWLNVGDGENFARQAWQNAGIKVLPGAYLGESDTHGHNPGAAYIRIALVASLDDVRQALKDLLPLMEAP